MKEIFAFIRKEFKHIFRDRRTTLIVLIMPIVQIVLFGFAISTDVHNAVVDIVGDASDPAVQRIIQRIEVDKDGHVDIYLRLFGDLGLDETVLVRDGHT